MLLDPGKEVLNNALRGQLGDIRLVLHVLIDARVLGLGIRDFFDLNIAVIDMAAAERGLDHLGVSRTSISDRAASSENLSNFQASQVVLDVKWAQPISSFQAL